MAESKGWIKTYRKIQDCWIWLDKEPFDKRSAWIDLLLTANHSDKKLLFNGSLITVKRGQIITSIRKLSEKWKWSYDKCSRFLKILESDGMLQKESDNFRTLLTIVNYEVYQDMTCTNECTDNGTNRTQASEQSSEQSEHGQVTNKNVKNDKNEKEDNTHAREDEIQPLPFDVDKVWKDTYKVYPKQRYSNSSKYAWLDLFKGIATDNQLNVAKMIVYAIQLYLDDYKKQNPDDETFRYVPRFDTWLKEDCMYWIGVYEEKVRGK